MRFLHCGDLHLGCLQFRLEQRYDDFFNTFKSIVDLAADRRVNCLIIAGDLFHHRSIEAYTLERTAKLLRPLKAKGIAVVATEGNHDKAYYAQRRSWLDFLREEGLIHLLVEGEELVVDGCRFVGYGYPGAGAADKLVGFANALERSELPTVALLHAGVNRLLELDMSGVPLAALDCFEDKVDYFALGHVHGQYEIDNRIFNGGAPECVHISESKCKRKGVYISEVSKGKVSAEFVPTKARRFVNLSLDGSREEILRALQEHDLQGAVLSLCVNSALDQSELAELSEQICAACGCLYAEVADTAAAFELIEGGAGEDIASIEREVFLQMAKEGGFEQPQRVGEVLGALKRAMISGEDAQAVFDELHKEISSWS